MITINQQPPQLTLANSNLVWTLSSNSSSRSQFQYIANLYDSGSTLLTQIKQQPNLNGKGVFDFGRILKQYIGYDSNVTTPVVGLTDGLFNKNTDVAKIYKVTIGEEWGTSSTSIVTTSSIVNSGSVPYYFLINGMIDPNYGQFDWNTSSYYNPQITPSTATFNYNSALTNCSRTQSLFKDDIMNIAIINGNISGSLTSAQDIYAMTINVYLNNTVVYNTDVYNVATTTEYYQGGPRTLNTQDWSAITQNPLGTPALNKQSEDTLLLYVGIGPANLTAQVAFNFSTQDWDYYTITLHPKAAAGINTSGIWDSFIINNFSKTCLNCGYNRVRFAWINDFGVWDWYNFTLASTRTNTIERNTYKANFVDYSTPIVPNTNIYNIKRRGTTSFDTKAIEEITVNSDWLTQSEADFLEPLFYSPNVYIQSGSITIPVMITNTELVSKTNPRNQKLFTYNISFQVANQKRSR